MQSMIRPLDFYALWCRRGGMDYCCRIRKTIFRIAKNAGFTQDLTALSVLIGALIEFGNSIRRMDRNQFNEIIV